MVICSKKKIGDISMYYEIHGEGEPIVFIAGFGADHTAWGEVLPLFKQSYQVILLDNRGIGQTDVPVGSYSIKQMAEDTAKLCEALSIKKAHFVGNSMGGFIVQHLAYAYPHLVKSAVLSNTTTATQCCFNIYVAAQLELLKAKAPLASLIKATASWVFSYSFLSRVGVIDCLVQMGLDNPYPFTIQGYEGQCAALDNFDSSTWVNKITVPTLVLGSDQDLIFSEKSVENLAKAIKGSEYSCFEQCGHLPFIEHPEKFFHAVNAFLEKNYE